MSLRRPLALLLALLAAPAGLFADPPSLNEIGQRITFRALDKNDPEILKAVATIVQRGFLADVVEVVRESSAAQPSPVPVPVPVPVPATPMRRP